MIVKARLHCSNWTGWSVYLPLYSFFTHNGKRKNAIWRSILRFSPKMDKQKST